MIPRLHAPRFPWRPVYRLSAFNHAAIPIPRTFAIDASNDHVYSEQATPSDADTVAVPNSAVDQNTTGNRGEKRKRGEKTLPDALVLRHLAAQHTRKRTGSLGGNLRPHYEEQNILNDPPWPKDVTLELLVASQAHIGHATSLWNPANSRYIFGIREGIHIISLEIIAQHLRRAAKVVSGVAERGGIILFVGTRPGFDACVVKAAELAAPAFHLFQKWTPGSLTNGQQILGKCKIKVVDEFDNEVRGLDETILDRRALKPDLVVCLNPVENHVMLHECALGGIPTMGIIDTDANPTWVTYPIPANDDSLRCVQVIAGVLGRAGQAGQDKRRRAAADGIFKHAPDDLLKLPSNFELPGQRAGGS